MKITSRLWLLISAFGVFILGLIWVFLIVLLPEFYLTRAYRELDSSADYVLQMWEQSGSAGDHKMLDKFVTDAGLHMDIRTKDGKVFYTGGWALEADVLTVPERERALQGLYITKRYVRPGAGDTLVMAKPVYTPQGETMLLLLCAPMAPMEDTQSLLQQYMLVISAVSLTVALVIGFLSSRMFVRPIRRAEQVAQRIALGDYSERLNSKDGSELGDLARALDNMASQLGQLEAMRQDFIATVSHQFKTPLSIIQGHTEWIQDSLPEAEAQQLQGSFEVIADEITRLDRMSRDILKLSELQSGVRAAGRVELPLLPFCQSILHSLEILAPNIRFTLQVPEHLQVLADASDLEHVFRNILQNAIVHSSASEVMVTVTREDACVRVVIRDNGKGLAGEQIAHLWERFYKGDRKDRSGSGLGMAIAAAVIENHGGTYGVESVLGRGTAIWFTLAME